jgi:hypothetical protein
MVNELVWWKKIFFQRAIARAYHENEREGLEQEDYSSFFSVSSCAQETFAQLVSFFSLFMSPVNS